MAERVTPEETIPTNTYYCHICSRNFHDLLADYTCPLCHSGFVELVENPAQQTNVNPASIRDRSNSNSTDLDVDSFVRLIASPFLNNLLQPPSSSAAAASTREASREGTSRTGVSSGNATTTQNVPPTGLQNFLQTLFQGLTNDGTFQIHFQINQGEGGSNATFPPLFIHSNGNPADYAWGPGGLDAIVTQLLNQVEGGVPPMARDKIDGLSETAVTPEQIDRRLQCAVCMDDFKLDEMAVRLMCEHMYHKGCIVPWLEKHNSCPVCRKSAETGQPLQSPPVHSQSSNTFFGPGQSSTAATTSSSSSGGGNTAAQSPPRNPDSTDRPQWMDIEDLD